MWIEDPDGIRLVLVRGSRRPPPPPRPATDVGGPRGGAEPVRGDWAARTVGRPSDRPRGTTAACAGQLRPASSARSSCSPAAPRRDDDVRHDAGAVHLRERHHAGAASSAPAATPGQQAAAALEALDERGRVAQLFLVGVRSTTSPRRARRGGRGRAVHGGPVEGPMTEVAATTQRWQGLARVRTCWIAADQEGGAVQTFTGPGFTRLPSAADQGRSATRQLSALAGDMGAELASAGVNLNLAPVADIVPAGTESGNRPSARSGASTAARRRGDRRGRCGRGRTPAPRVTATLKHFPGLGRVQGNTDTDTGVVDQVTTAGDEQVAAFGSLARSAARPFVMVSSATYARIDPGHAGRVLAGRPHRRPARAAGFRQGDRHRRRGERGGRPGRRRRRAGGAVPRRGERWSSPWIPPSCPRWSTPCSSAAPPTRPSPPRCGPPSSTPSRQGPRGTAGLSQAPTSSRTSRAHCGRRARGRRCCCRRRRRGPTRPTPHPVGPPARVGVAVGPA